MADNNPGHNQESLGKNWNDFWAGVGGIFKTKPITGNSNPNIGAGYNAYGHWDSKQDPLPARQMAGPSKPNRMEPTPQPASNISGSNALAAIHGRYNSPSNLGQQGIPPAIARPADPDPMAKFIERRAQLEKMLDEDYTGDPEVDAMIEQAYSSALDNVSKARGNANANFEKSDANIAALSAGHVKEIETKDRDAVNRIGGELQGNYNNTYDSATKELSADRDAELQARTAMLQRLGIQEAGLDGVGQTQTDAISRLTQDKAGALQQAQTYQAADLVRNTEQAQSQASAGLERRGELHKQLQGILGQLDESEANINMRKSQDHAQAWQQGRSEFNSRQKGISDSLSDIDNQMEDKKNSDRDYALKLRELDQKNSSGSTGGVFEAVDNSFRNRGVAPDQYRQAYNDVLVETPYNAQVDGDKAAWLVRKMKAKNSKLSNSDIGSYVMGVLNYGTDKLGN